jgi:hypothetical protein
MLPACFDLSQAINQLWSIAQMANPPCFLIEQVHDAKERIELARFQHSIDTAVRLHQSPECHFIDQCPTPPGVRDERVIKVKAEGFIHKINHELGKDALPRPASLAKGQSATIGDLVRRV